jgi:hypothetical protein
MIPKDVRRRLRESSWFFKGNNRPLICLGLYWNSEKRLLSFFHELGHIKNLEQEFESAYDEEESAWSFAFEEARKYGFVFCKSTTHWANKCLASYARS